MKEDVNLPEAEHLKEVADRIKEMMENPSDDKECLVTVLSTLGKE